VGGAPWQHVAGVAGGELATGGGVIILCTTLLYIFYRESPIEYPVWCTNDFTAHA
jgi:hypothetical protein